MSYKALLLVLEPSEQMIGTVLSRNPVNDEKKREMTMAFPQHPALLGVCSMSGASFIGLLHTLETAHRCLHVISSFS